MRSNDRLNDICDWTGLHELVIISRKHGKDRIDTTYNKHELIRMHCGRKTFASLSLEQGMKIGGWKDHNSLKRYMNLTDDIINKPDHFLKVVLASPFLDGVR